MSYEDNLVIQAKNGDSNAINFLLDNNKSYIYAIAFAVLKNHEDAEDATQKTMITVWQNIGTLENPEAFKSWLYHIAHTRSLNVLQSKKNNRFILDEDISDLPHLEDMENDFMLPQAYAERDDLRERLNRIINGLSAVQRETIVLYYFNDRSVSEIAEIMDCYENTVKSRLYLARNSIKTEIEEQERKSGEKFYGIAVGVLPVGYFIAEHVKHSLPSYESLGRLVASAQQAGQQAVAEAVHSSTVSGQASSVAVKTAAKGLPTVAKVLFAAVGIIIAATAGVVTAKLVIDSQQNGNTSSSESQAFAETKPVPTETLIEASTEQQTEPPTEPSEAAAFRAYLEILETNESAIKNYNWQLSGGETKPIAFKDIMGDSTPEMIYLYAEKVYDTHNGKNSGTAGIRVYTYLDGEAKSAYENKSWSQNYVQTDEPYMLFQIQDDNALYAYCDTSKTYSGFEILRFTDNGVTLSEEKIVEYYDGMPQSSGKIEGNDVSAAEAKQKGKSLLQSAPNALMISTIGKFVYDTDADRLAFLGIDSTGKENQAMTYDEAIAFLNSKLGNNMQTDAKNTAADFSTFAGEYETNTKRMYAAKLNIDNTGRIKIHLQHIFTGSQSDYTGNLSDPASIGNNAYTFTLKNIKLSDGTQAENEIDNAFKDDCTMSFYPKGFLPRNLKEGQFQTFLQALPKHIDESLRTDFIFFSDNIMFSPPVDPENPVY